MRTITLIESIETGETYAYNDSVETRDSSNGLTEPMAAGPLDQAFVDQLAIAPDYVSAHNILDAAIEQAMAYGYTEAPDWVEHRHGAIIQAWKAS